MTATRCPAVRWVALVSGLVALALAPGDALACFFYEGPEGQQLVEQTAMQVVLRQIPADVEHPEGRTKMILDVRAVTAVPDLGWVVPVPRYPDVDVENTFSFVSLDAATAPVFRTSGGTGGSALAASGSAGCSGATREEADEPPQDYPQVNVWDATEAGPYLITVLTAESLDALRAWVSENGFPWLPSIEPDFARYVEDGWFFVAAKVRPSTDAPSLVPLSLEWEGGDLVVPLVSSRRDATADMSLVVWVIADSPAVPRNWAQVAVPAERIVVDEAGSNYADLVAETIDVAGAGQAFVTEYVQRAETTALEINQEPTRTLVGTTGWVTRLYARVDPDDLTVDPVFALDPDVTPISQLHDLTAVEGGPYWGAAIQPLAGLAPVGLVLLARVLRRRRA